MLVVAGTDMAVFYLLCPHPGTDVYEDFQKDALLNFGIYLTLHRLIQMKILKQLEPS